jgi:hypothetical protein
MEAEKVLGKLRLNRSMERAESLPRPCWSAILGGHGELGQGGVFSQSFPPSSDNIGPCHWAEGNPL